MITSEARILANQANALKSSGPKTDEGKAVSRTNAVKHGLTGAGVALSSEDAAAVEYRFASLRAEMQPASELGRLLIQRVALHSVRMDRSVLNETAALSERVRQAEADFVAPEGMPEVQADKLRAEAAAIAMFDPSKEAILARRYEAAAERGFYRALKDFRQVEREFKAGSPNLEPVAAPAAMGSFGPVETSLDLLESLGMTTQQTAPPQTTQNPVSTRIMPAPSSFDVPFAIGRSR